MDKEARARLNTSGSSAIRLASCTRFTVSGSNAIRAGLLDELSKHLTIDDRHRVPAESCPSRRQRRTHRQRTPGNLCWTLDKPLAAEVLVACRRAELAEGIVGAVKGYVVPIAEELRVPGNQRVVQRFPVIPQFAVADARHCDVGVRHRGGERIHGGAVPSEDRVLGGVVRLPPDSEEDHAARLRGLNDGSLGC
jgi:hypothetical protein